MNKKISAEELSDISQTMLLTLYLRCLESERDDCMISSPIYRQLVEQIDYDFEKWDGFDDLQAFLAARTIRFEEIINEFLEKYDDGIVVSIAAGLGILHTLNNNPNTDWYDLDLSGVIKIRKQLFPETENHHYIAASAWDSEWINNIPKDRPILVVIEGLLIYFEEEDIKLLFNNLIDNLGANEIAFDSISEYIWKLEMQSKPDYLDFDKTPFIWAIDNMEDINAWHPRIKLDKVLYQSDLYDERGSEIVKAVIDNCPLGNNIYRVARYTVDSK